MFKELLLAVILGALLGFGLTGGYLALKHNQKSTGLSASANISPSAAPDNPLGNGTVISPALTPTPGPEGSDNHLVIDQPDDGLVVADAKITLKGSTNSQSNLVVTTGSQNYYLKSDAQGKFSLDLELDSGSNLITVNSIDSQDNQATAQLVVTYSTAKF